MAKRNENQSKKRKQNKLILFAAEGHNATETLYLKDLIKNLNGVVLRKAHGNETDPIGMVENLIASMDALILLMHAKLLSHLMPSIIILPSTSMHTLYRRNDE